MWTVEAAVTRVLESVVTMGIERVPLARAFGRFAAGDVIADVDLPPWDNSAMDGYAVCSSDFVDGQASLVVQEEVVAGAVARLPVRPGWATRIMTGAPMPPGADAVVMVEDSALEGDRVVLRGGVTAGRHVRRQGSDVARGDVVVGAGERLTPGAVGMLGSLGLTAVDVRRRPVVAVVGTGDEVVRPGESRGPAQIWSSNHLTLAGLALDAGADVIDGGHAGDDLDALRRVIGDVLHADVVLTSGGVSAGSRDLVRDALAQLGVETQFWKVKMKPGMPVVFGTRRVEGHATAVFGLPGNPVSCMVNFLQFVRPWIRRSLGDRRPFLPVVEATAAHAMPGAVGRARLERVVLAWDGARWTCSTTGDQSSGVLRSMVRASGLLMVPADSPGPAQGEQVRVQLTDPSCMDQDHAGYPW